MELKVVALKQKTNSKDSTEYLCGHNLESIYLSHSTKLLRRRSSWPLPRGVIYSMHMLMICITS